MVAQKQPIKNPKLQGLTEMLRRKKIRKINCFLWWIMFIFVTKIQFLENFEESFIQNINLRIIISVQSQEKDAFKVSKWWKGVHFDRKRHVSGNSGRLSNLQKFSVGDSGVVLRQFFADLYFHLYQALALFVDSIMFEIPGSSQPFLLSRIIENGLPPSTA